MPDVQRRWTVRVPGVKLAQQLMFRAMGLTARKAPTGSIQQTFRAETLEATLRETSKIIG